MTPIATAAAAAVAYKSQAKPAACHSACPHPGSQQVSVECCRVAFSLPLAHTPRGRVAFVSPLSPFSLTISPGNPITIPSPSHRHPCAPVPRPETRVPPSPSLAYPSLCLSLGPPSPRCTVVAFTTYGTGAGEVLAFGLSSPW
ncbi:hypothetical protein K431DRAFT_288364 [Polychaeton citri CBS 116435]|uniref:Uncharacterized protein n=1 Tax=Polychaeton citri CBS 116435 TaxID=1314669 RepID=A0A9P4Q3G3_9PEZI|nr:hypothetical protein K431DRAFT_288364 [Polychaeton citri CBS 116435]